jgi:hypothetical protein
MSEYYNSNKITSWNYGGKNWKLSLSKIDLFSSCPEKIGKNGDSHYFFKII